MKALRTSPLVLGALALASLAFSGCLNDNGSAGTGDAHLAVKMTVYRMVHGGDLPAVRVGRSFRVPEKAVHDYLRAAFIEAG
jgi:excisionase family DNA binding protein